LWVPLVSLPYPKSDWWSSTTMTMSNLLEGISPKGI
jgi:hypothetical protein